MQVSLRAACNRPDKICYLEGGKVAEMGTYQELMEKDGLFADLAKRQMA